MLQTFVLVLLFATPAFAQEQDLEQEMLSVEAAPSETASVVVETQEDPSLSYKKRRSSHGALFSINKENFYPVDYRSLFNDSYIEDIIGTESMALIGIELGYKHNIGILSFAVLGIYSQGSIEGAFSGATRTIQVGRQGLSANVALDAIFEEPWLAPYAQVGVHQFNVTETTSTDSLSATTGISYNYRYGFLLQLDWIENSFDKSAKADRLRSSGLENTYVDFYFAEHVASNTAIDPTTLAIEGDPNMFSSGEIGIGLKMEF